MSSADISYIVGQPGKYEADFDRLHGEILRTGLRLSKGTYDFVIVAKQAKVVVGWLGITPLYTDYDLDPEITVLVDPNAQGKGIGTGLVEAVIGEACRRRMPRITAMVIQRGGSMAHILERAGFVEKQNYYKEKYGELQAVMFEDRAHYSLALEALVQQQTVLRSA